MANQEESQFTTICEFDDFFTFIHNEKFENEMFWNAIREW